MEHYLEALLEQIPDTSMRAAISAGWELGDGLSPVKPAEQQTLKQIEKSAQLLSRKMDLDVDLVHGAALMSMSLNRVRRQ